MTISRALSVVPFLFGVTIALTACGSSGYAAEPVLSARIPAVQSSASDSITSECVPGGVPENSSMADPPFYTLPEIYNDHPDENMVYGYALTIKDTSSKTMHVTGFSVVFSSQAGTESGDDSRTADTWILPGQSWTWDPMPWTAFSPPPYIGGMIDTGATCRLVSWSA
jgi:hypothetical protein